MTSRNGRNSSPFTPGLVVGRRAWLTAGLGALVLGPSALVRADDRTDYLINLLRTSSTTRVRAQAALSLGRLSRSAEALAALVQALGNTSEDPTVRVAAAAALGRMGDRAAMAPLQQAARDRNATVRQAATEALAALRSSGSGSGGSGHETRPEPSGGGGPDRFYVGIGQPGTSVSGVDDAVLGRMRTFLTEQADRTSGVRVAPSGESASQVRRILSRERLSGFYLDSALQSLGPSGSGTRAQVQLIVNTYPGRALRGMLSGAATVPNSSGPEAEWRAIEGACRGALRRLPQIMEASARRG